MSARQGAVRHFEDELARRRSPREWWRIGTLPGGEPVGFVIPGRNDYGAIIGYVGVLPAQRGHGYIRDVRARILRAGRYGVIAMAPGPLPTLIGLAALFVAVRIGVTVSDRALVT